ncbi:hypothetical protein OZX62_03055 [Bifidobacterium sp. ESL0690]|uniref:hypothetical protein n=1 Tax=Bifidobacterium sp. ESL0690 TaxID=2983214 RepID=UPI0023F803C4|nr:hypothetical protein [Bifidobacterium sp. ESL0690]WEV47274.1 hypothetical protein OZX62_03055 [Bifidobacterium sp. ESL0690]
MDQTQNVTSMKPHDGSCEAAYGQRCKCHCHGGGHRRTFVERALWSGYGPNHKDTYDKFSSDLDKAFGPNFKSLFDTPKENPKTEKQEIACGRRKWKILNPSKTIPETGALASQIEQRIVDTSLHDLFIMVWKLPSIPTGKLEKWKNIKKYLMPTSLPDLPPSNARSGFLWSAEMSAVSNLIFKLDEVPKEEQLTQLLIQELSDPRYSVIAFPRAKKAKYVNELIIAGKPEKDNIQNLAQDLSTRITQAARQLNKEHKKEEVLFLTEFIGSASCLDLWKQPAAVHFCLQPLLKELSGYTTNHGFPRLHEPEDAQILINKYLKDRWGTNW